MCIPYSNKTLCLYATITALFLLLITGSLHAEDYILATTNGTTTYYLARNGTSGVQRVESFDPDICIWHCENFQGTSSTLNNGTEYGWLYQTVSNTKYYLSSGGGTLSLVTSPSKTTGQNSQNYTCWRTDGTYVYNYYETRFLVIFNSQTSYYLALNQTPEAATNTNSNTAIPYVVTTYNLDDQTTAPTISVTGLSGNSGIQLSHTDVTGTYTTQYYKYTIGSAHYWYNGTDHDAAPQTADFATMVPDYEWSISSGNDYADIDENGAFISKRLATTVQDVIVTLTTTHNGSGYSNTRTYTITVQDFPEIVPNAGIGGYNVIQNVGESTTLRGYTQGGYTAPYTKYGWEYDKHNVYNGKDYEYNNPGFYQGDENLIYSWTLSGEDSEYCSLSSATVYNPTLTYVTDAGHDVIVQLYLTITHPDFPDFSVSAGPFNVTLFSNTPDAPVLTRTGNQITMSTTVQNASIYYTINESDPSSNQNGSRQIYTEPITITTSPLVIKACTRRYDNYSNVVTETYLLKLDPPVITISAYGDVTISNAASNPADAQIYYSTDNSTPATLYENAFTVENGITVTAMAKKQGYDDSDNASSTFNATQVATPTINITTNGVTFSCETPGVTYHYTINNENI